MNSDEIDISMFNNDGLKLLLLYSLTGQSTKASLIADLTIENNEINISNYESDLVSIKRGYIDYFQGRIVKANLSGNKVNAYLYNRDMGHQAMQIIVQKMRDILKI
jgi:hypothetical protein